MATTILRTHYVFMPLRVMTEATTVKMVHCSLSLLVFTTQLQAQWGQTKLGDDIGSGLSFMAVCFDFRSTNVVQLRHQ